MTPVNNVVDISNYVLMECGQPLHTFDFSKLEGGEIIVRRPLPGETIEAIDHKTYRLEPDMCMICDARRPVAIGGVMVVDRPRFPRPRTTCSWNRPMRRETDELRSAQDSRADADKIQQLSQKLQWDLRVFDERQKSVSFVCESPALIEQRLGALARAILAEMR